MNPYRILIVEDEAIVAMDIADRLSAMGYRIVDQTANGRDALKLAEKEHPDLVMMDVQIQGDMDGIATATEIRRQFHVPVIFLTAYAEDATLDRAKLAEPFGYILKPFTDRELKSTIETALYKHRAEEEIRRLNRLYDVLSQVNQTILRVNSREGLLREVCRLVVERGGVDLAWVGMIEKDTGLIVPAAHYGNSPEFLRQPFSCSDEKPEIHGNPGQAIREGRPVVCDRCTPDCLLYPFHPKPADMGFLSCGSFPLRFRKEICGILGICSSESGFFQEREIDLLEEVAMDVSFAMDKIESDHRQELLHAEFQKQTIFLRTLMDAMPFPVYYKDADCRYLGCNTAFEDFLHLKREEIVGKTVFDLWRGELAELYDRADRALLNNPKIQIYEAGVESRTGDRYEALFNKSVFHDPDGKPAGIVGVIQDITERKASERALHENRERLKLALAAARMAVWEWNVRTGTVLWSPECLEILGIEIPAKSLLDLVHAEDRSLIVDGILPAVESGGVFSKELRIAHPKGGERWISVMGRSECDDSRAPVRVVGTVRDITTQKQMEEERERVNAQLSRSQKMEALGTLAGGVAHDFNNILGIIIGYTEMADWDTEEGSHVKEDLQEVLKAAQRAKELVRQIMTFSRSGEPEKKPLQIGLIVKEALKMIRAALPSNIAINHDSASEAFVQGDATQIHQLLVNLCTNAGQAMREKGGLLRVNLTDVGPNNPPASHLGLEPGHYVKLTVQDTGHGIPPEIMDRIFDPFFTTREPGSGPGLGLAVVHGIVKNYGGAVDVSSVLGEGATFNIFLPAMGRSSSGPASNGEPPRGTEHILVVDDETMLAAAMAQMLRRLGYSVEHKTNVGEALESFHQTPRPFDLLVTDMTMPQMTGVELATELRRVQPDLPVVLCTGHGDTIGKKEAPALGISEFLIKPVRLLELAEAIRRALDAKPGRAEQPDASR